MFWNNSGVNQAPIYISVGSLVGILCFALFISQPFAAMQGDVQDQGEQRAVAAATGASFVKEARTGYAPPLVPASPPSDKENSTEHKEGDQNPPDESSDTPNTSTPLTKVKNLVNKSYQRALSASSSVFQRTALQDIRASSKEYYRREDSSTRASSTRLASLPTTPSIKGDNDPNKQDRKEAFLKKKSDSFDLNEPLHTPKTPFVLSTGTVIPALMKGGVNSDLPGALRAQVSQHVYDTPSGEFVLVPQGSTLFGRYQSRISYGQERVLVVWDRLTFPNGSAITLHSMTGADSNGYSGFHDKVNNHYFKVFGNAILVSVFTAGVQLSQPSRSSFEQETPSETAAAALGQQLGQTGIELARKNLSIQPTLEIRPGYRFVVQVNKDMTFEEAYKA